MLLAASPVEVAGQSPRDSRIEIGLSGGIANLSRGQGKVPSAAASAGLRINRHIVIGVEGAFAGTSNEVKPLVRTTELWRKRREYSAGAFVRMHAWGDERVRVEPVVGIGFADWIAEDATRAYFTTGYTPWAPVPEGYLADAPDPRTWAINVGVEMPFGGKSFSVVPEFRMRFPFQAPNPSIRGGLGIRWGR